MLALLHREMHLAAAEIHQLGVKRYVQQTKFDSLHQQIEQVRHLWHQVTACLRSLSWYADFLTAW